VNVTVDRNKLYGVLHHLDGQAIERHVRVLKVASVCPSVRMCTPGSMHRATGVSNWVSTKTASANRKLNVLRGAAKGRRFTRKSARHKPNERLHADPLFHLPPHGRAGAVRS
jgi:hypothetical protein